MTDNAVGLLLNYCLGLPNALPGRRGFGFRCVQCMAHAENQSLVAVAKRMGFKECLVRWTWVLPEEAEGNGIRLRDGVPLNPRPGQHGIVFSFCADSWEIGGREHLQRRIDRQ